MAKGGSEPLLPPLRSSRPGEQASFQAALASPEEFAPPASPSRLLAGEIAETPAAFLA